MHTLRPFEIALIGVFCVLGIAGIVALSMFQAKPSEEELLYGERVSVWGTLDQQSVQEFLAPIQNEQTALNVVSYSQIDARVFVPTLVDAIAEGRSPDLLIIPHTLLVTLRTKLTPITYDYLPQRTFKDRYIDGADIFMRSDGVYGIPFGVDPLMMYWNRDIFATGGLATPPSTWEQVIGSTVHTLTQNDANGMVTQSALAFGTYANIIHAKDILSMLFLQMGSPIIAEHNNAYRVTIQDGGTGELPSGVAVLQFYTQFAKQSNELYTWVGEWPSDRSTFGAGTLAMYFGKASERTIIERENPNLNYDVARVPQGATATTHRTYGDFYAFAIPRASQNVRGAYAVAELFASPQFSEGLTDRLDLAPVHRTLYGTIDGDPFREILKQSALVAHGWLDPAPEKSDAVFRTLVEEVLLGRGRLDESIKDAVRKLEALF